MCATEELRVQDGKKGEWSIETFNVEEEDALFSRSRNGINAVPAGTYKRLLRKNTVVMSNTPMEIRTNRAFIRAARGNVLINGLGMGMVLESVLKKPEVESVTVIELSQDLIDLVSPYFANEEKLKIIQASAFDYKPEKGAYFDTVWHDIWDYISEDNLKEMATLHRKYGKRCDWQGSWAKAECQILKRNGRCFSRYF